MTGKLVTSSEPISISRPSEPSQTSSSQLAISERITLGLGFLIVLLLKLAYPFYLRFDSDEPQHLHVVWGWAHGLLQYRDVFDNHSPLFQLLCAPFFRLFGERADIVIPMRFVMIPFFGITLWSVYRIGQTLYSKRAALWSALATALVPVYFFTSTEFRTDDLWIVFWMLSLTALVVENRGWAFWPGFFMGCAFATSMKSSLLLASLLGAGICVMIFKRIWQPEEGKAAGLIQPPVGSDLGRFVLGLIATLIVPGLIVLFFYWKGAFREFYYCVIQHNVVPGMGNSKLGMHCLRLPIAFPFLFGIGYALYRYAENASLGARRALLFLTGGIYVAALRSFWPLITAQDYLPFIPLACLIATPTVLWVIDRVRPQILRTGILVLIVGGMVALTVTEHPFWENDTAKQIRMVQMVLDLTKPDEWVMDGKGETIFRKRPYYYVLEGIAIERIRRGLIPNNIVEKLIETETAVVHATARLQGEGLKFVKANYLPVENLRVLGQILNEQKKDSDAVYPFAIAVPSTYQVVAQGGPVSGTLDGTPLNGPRRLEIGPHELRIAGGHGPIALFWARAAEKGYSPFKSP